jgi:hypothetical protein
MNNHISDIFGRSIVLISGAGQLGSRHLQGLLSCRCPLDIHVRDNHPDSLKTAEERWQQVAGVQSVHRVFFRSFSDDIPKRIDVAIVATPADVRPQIVAAIARQSQVSYWILEKVLARSEKGLADINASISDPSRAWVNTPRRSLPWHRELRATFTSGRPMTLQVAGSNWGIACNSIHFLDMFAWWTGERVESVCTDRLETKWIAAKRPGNMEVMGTLEVSYSSGSRVVLSCEPGEVRYFFQFSDADHAWSMNEERGTALRSDGLAVLGSLPYQSEETGPLVQRLLDSGTCLLPTLEESSRMHSVFLRSLLNHWRKYMDPHATEVPIT